MKKEKRKGKQKKKKDHWSRFVAGAGTKGPLISRPIFRHPGQTFGPGWYYQPRPKALWSRFVAGTGTKGLLLVDLDGSFSPFSSFFSRSTPSSPLPPGAARLPPCSARLASRRAPPPAPSSLSARRALPCSAAAPCLPRAVLRRPLPLRQPCSGAVLPLRAPCSAAARLAPVVLHRRPPPISSAPGR